MNPATFKYDKTTSDNVEGPTATTPFVDYDEFLPVGFTSQYKKIESKWAEEIRKEKEWKKRTAYLALPPRVRHSKPYAINHTPRRRVKKCQLP